MTSNDRNKYEFEWAKAIAQGKWVLDSLTSDDPESKENLDTRGSDSHSSALLAKPAVELINCKTPRKPIKSRIFDSGLFLEII